MLLSATLPLVMRTGTLLALPGEETGGVDAVPEILARAGELNPPLRMMALTGVGAGEGGA